MINQIAQEQAEKLVRPVRIGFEDYTVKADDHRNMIVDRFQREL